MIEWENGEVTSEPLAIIAKDDPATCAQYALDNNLLDTDGWKQFRKLANRTKVLVQQLNQAKLCSYCTSPKYKNGFQIPRNYEEAIKLDEKFGNSRWKEATATERLQLDEYDVFDDLGHKYMNSKHSRLTGFKKIRTHLLYDVKHDGCHKA